MAATQVTGRQIGALDLTTEVTGILPVANGGTGDNNLASGNILLGNGTSAVTELAPSTVNNVARSNGSAWVSAAPEQVTSITSSATPTIDVTTTQFYDITALTANITSLSTTGTARNWQPLWVSIKAASLQTVAWNSANFATGVAAWPTSVPAGKTITAAGRYNPALGKFVLFAVDTVGY